MSNNKNSKLSKGPGPSKRSPGRRGRGRGGPQRSRQDTKSRTAPVAKSKMQRTTKPEMKTKPNGDAQIKHREYIMDIVAGTGSPTPFALQQLAINPGQANTFPWLSKIAGNYESYIFDSIVFCYETEAPTALGGTLVLTVDYDASDAAPSSKQQAMTYRSAVRSAPWTYCEHRSLSEDLHKMKSNFIRPGTQPPNTDIKTYDIGNLFIISQGVTTSEAVMGELYVEYNVRLLTPVYEPSTVVLFGGLVTSGGTETLAAPLGDAPIIDAQSVGLTYEAATGLVSFGGVGTFTAIMIVNGTVLTGLDWNASAFTVITSDVSVDAAGTSLIAIITFQGATGTLDPTVLGATITNSTLLVATAPTGSLD